MMLLTACVQAANPVEPVRVVSSRLQLATKLEIRDVNLDKPITARLLSQLKEKDDRADRPLGTELFIQRFSDFTFLEEGRKEKLDVYIPNGPWKLKRPAVLFIHGGGFKSGDKAESRSASVCADLARAGYVAVSCNYLLVTKEKPAVWPQNIADCREAVRWMRQHADSLGIDARRIAVAGGSAGGYLALMVGLSEEKAELGGNPQAVISSKVSAVIDMYGVTSSEKHGKETLILAGPDAVRLFSPMTHVTPRSVPILILHGTADKTVDIQESKNLEEVLIKNKVDYQLIAVEEGVHTFDLRPIGKGWTLHGLEKGEAKQAKSDAADLRAITTKFLEDRLGR